MQKSMRFFIRMLPVFFGRVNPASHIEKPACMKNTSAAPSRTQMVLTELNVMGTILSVVVVGKYKERERLTEKNASVGHPRPFDGETAL